MNYILFDSNTRIQLLPLVYIRPVSYLRVGILTIKEKWEILTECEVSTDVPDYLKDKYGCLLKDENIVVDGSILPNEDLINKLTALAFNEALSKEGKLIGCKIAQEKYDEYISNIREGELNVFNEVIEFEGDLVKIDHLVDIYLVNGRAIKNDYDLITNHRSSAPINSSNQVLGDQIFVEEGADMNCAVLNSLEGPIYIGKNAKVMEGVTIRGPFSLGDNSVIKMGAKLYGNTTIGPSCTVGGEITNSVFIGYSNKGHDGFMGNSVIGEWCNLGANTNTSNLKNTYGKIKYWNYSEKKLVDSGEIRMGLIMADYSKCAISSMFNSGTIVGVNANIAQNGFVDKMVPSFSWITANENSKYQIEKAIEVATAVALRRDIEFDAKDEAILRHVFVSSEREL